MGKRWWLAVMVMGIFSENFYGQDRKGMEENGALRGIRVEKTWELPGELEEISGITFAGSETLACVQDEKGRIYMFDLTKNKITDEIPFAGKGDYEGIAIQGNMAYVLESNGMLSVIRNFRKDPVIQVYKTGFSQENNLEGLFYDSANDRLLLAVKDKDPWTKKKKNIYSFDLRDMKLSKNPVFTLDPEEIVSNPETNSRDKLGNFRPSEIALDKKGAVYLLEGVGSRLLILDPSGKVRAIYHLDRKTFPQPEGLAFDLAGNLYISSEGKPAVLHKIVLE